MAVKFTLVSAFLCERVLQEKDNVFSAIRIVDIFQIPENATEETVVRFVAVVLLKALPSDESFRIGVTLVRVAGDREKLKDPSGQQYKLTPFEGDQSVPVGFTLIMQIEVTPKTTGTSYLEVDIDGEIVARIPFTIRRLQAAAQIQ